MGRNEGGVAKHIALAILETKEDWERIVFLFEHVWPTSLDELENVFLQWYPDLKTCQGTTKKCFVMTGFQRNVPGHSDRSTELEWENDQHLGDIGVPRI